MTPKDMQRLVVEIRDILSQRFPPSYEQVLKYNRNQPRGPKGSPTGGQFVKGASQGLGSAPGSEMSAIPGMERTMGGARYADIMNAPTGEGFRNRPRGVGIPEPEEPKGSKTLEALQKADTAVKDSRPLGGGANASAIVTLEDGTEAVYKPERGENWTASFTNHDIKRYIKNRDFSLAEREAFAFEVDQAMGLGIVPETVLHTNVDETNINVDTSDDDGGGGGGGYDSDELRSMYEKYKEKALESAYDSVGGEMEQLYQEAQKDHAKEIENRAQEILDIWNEEVKDFPESPYGSGSVMREHPVLPLGSKEQFERREDKGVLDPIDIMDEAKVDVEYKLNEDEEDRVREIIRQRLAEGYQEYGDIDPDRAKEHLDRDKWIEDHADTENRLLESKIQGFDTWKQSNYPDSGGGYGGGGGEDRNPDAPHPQGGSFQHFRSNADSYGNMDAEDGARLAVLDYLIGTMDRHGQNLMFENDKPVAIDNGYSMPATSGTDDFQFRSDGVGEWLSSRGSRNVPPDLRAQLHEAVTKTDWQAMVDRHPSMNAKERQAFLSRVRNMQIALQTEEGLRELWVNLNRM